MAARALLLELALVHILVAVRAFELAGPVLPGLFALLVALLALGVLVLAYEREPGLGVVVEIVFLPVRRVMALFAQVPEFLLVRILLLMAVHARVGQRPPSGVYVALVARGLKVLAVELVTLVPGRVVVEGGLFPVLRVMALFAGPALELVLVLVLVAVGAGLVLYRLVDALHMALVARGLQVLAVEPVARVSGPVVVEGLLFPVLDRVARIACRALELVLVLVLVAVFAELVRNRLVYALLVALFALDLQVPALELVALIRRRVVVERVLAPAAGHMAGVALFSLELLLVRVGVAARPVAGSGLYRLVRALDMALVARGRKVLSVERVAFIPGRDMLELVGFPVFGRMAGVAKLSLELGLVRVLVAVVALLESYGLPLVLSVALGALHILVFQGKWVGRVPVVVELRYVLPALDVVALRAVLVELLFVFVLMAANAGFGR